MHFSSSQMVVDASVNIAAGVAIRNTVIDQATPFRGINVVYILE